MAKTLTQGVLAFAGALALPFGASAHAQEAVYQPPQDELVEAMAIMEVMFPAEIREETMLSVATSMGGQAAEGMMQGPIFEEPGIKAIVEKFLSDLPETMRPAISKHLPGMIEATAVAYTREFTLEELQDIRAFADTPSGTRYFSSVQNLLNDPVVAEANTAFFQDVSVISQQQSQAVQQEVIEYLQANPDVMQRLQDAGVGSGS